MSKNYSPSFMVLCNEVPHLIHIASSFTNSAIELEKSSDLSMHLQSFYALVSMAFEVFPKVLIGCEVCEKYQKVKNIDTKEIVKKIFKQTSSLWP